MQNSTQNATASAIPPEQPPTISKTASDLAVLLQKWLAGATVGVSNVILAIGILLFWLSRPKEKKGSE